MRYLACLVALTLAGCGSSPTAPSAPTPPPIPTVQGQWTGDYQISSCTSTGTFFASFCSTFSVGAVFPITLVLNQSGQAVSGTATLGGVNVPVTGTITTAGRVLLNGNASVASSGSVVQLQVSNWDTGVSGTSMSGGWSTLWTTTAASGSATTGQTIRVLTKTG